MTDAATATGPHQLVGARRRRARASTPPWPPPATGWWRGRRHDGFWQGELEGDTTLESYLILIEAFFNRRETDKVRDLARVIRAEALPEGGWSQYLGGPPELSVSSLSYFALKVAGESAEAPHMRAARATIRALGGVGRANTYTRHHLAMFGQVPWESVPAIPPEMLFFPRRRRSPSTTCRPGRAPSSSRSPSSGPKSRSSRCPRPAASRSSSTMRAELGPVDPPPAARLEDGLSRHRQAAQGRGARSGRRRSCAGGRSSARAPG